jgi:hypothetical protein
LALVGRRCGIGVVAVEEVVQIEVGVATRAGMDIDVDEVRRPVDELDLKPGLLAGFADGRLPWPFSSVDVTARGDPMWSR